MEDVLPSPLQISVDLYSLIDVENYDARSSHHRLDTTTSADRNPYPVSHSVDLFPAQVVFQNGALLTEPSLLPARYEVSLHPPIKPPGEVPETRSGQPTNDSTSLGRPDAFQILTSDDANDRGSGEANNNTEHWNDQESTNDAQVNGKLVSFRVDGVLIRLASEGFISSNPNLLMELGYSETQDTIIEIPTNIVSLTGFKGFHSVMYPHDQTAQTYEEWLGALHLSTLWDLIDIRAKAIAGISGTAEFPSHEPVKLAQLATKYRVGKWLRNAYIQIVEYPNLTIEDFRRSADAGTDLLEPPKINLLLYANTHMYQHGGKRLNPNRCKWCSLSREDCSSWGSGYSPSYYCYYHDRDAEFIVDQLFEDELEGMGLNVGPPPSGRRVALKTGAFYSALSSLALHDWDGVSNEGNPVFFASALQAGSVIPCIAGGLRKLYANVAADGHHIQHEGRFDLLPYIDRSMVLVETSYGRIPEGRRAIRGGYEEDGRKLYHAVASVGSVRVPGKTGEHLRAAKVLIEGVEHTIEEHYEILCWR